MIIRVYQNKKLLNVIRTEFLNIDLQYGKQLIIPDVFRYRYSTVPLNLIENLHILEYLTLYIDDEYNIINYEVITSDK